MKYRRKFFGIVMMIGIILFIMITLDFNNFFHLDALLLVLIGTIGYVLASTSDKSLSESIGDGAVNFGWLGSLIGVITIASDEFMLGKLEDLGPAIAMTLHPMFYGYFIRLITKAL